MTDSYEDFWSNIKKTELPIVLYGTGDGADMILSEFERRSIRVQACFASDGFVRSRYFHGFRVISYSDAEKEFGKMAVILGFGTHDRAVIENIKRIGSRNELYMPDMLRDGDGNLFDEEYASRHRRDIEWAYSILEDEKSWKSYESVIRYRLSGRIDYLLDGQEDDRESWKLLKIGADESFVDIGAYNGDTIERFASLAPSWKAVYGFEPDPKSFRKLQKNTEGLRNIELFNAFVCDSCGSVQFSCGKGRGSHRSSSDKMIQSLTIDSALGGKPATILKFDTEGYESEALDGGHETILKYRPRMILSAYHKIDDFWRLPRKVLSLDSSYRFYMRKSPAIPYWDTNYYIF